MTIAAAFAGIAAGFSAALGGPYHPGNLVWHGEPDTDDGGSIVTAGVPVEKPCSVQIDSITEAMRAQDGYAEKDVRLIVLAFEGEIDTDASVEVLTGAFVPTDWIGIWAVQSAARDPMGIGWECRARRA